MKCNCTTFAALDLCPSPPVRDWPVESLLGKLHICSGIIMPHCSVTVCLSVPWCSCHRCTAALGYRHTGCLQLSYVRTADCESNCYQRGISSRRPWGVELPSAGAYRLVAPGAVTGLPRVICPACSPVKSVEAVKTAYPYYVA